MGRMMSDGGREGVNGAAQAGAAVGPGDNSQPVGLDAGTARALAAARAQLREGFGNIVMAMLALPRYRHQTLADLQHLVLEPLLKDRVSIAYPPDREQNPLADSLGVAIWASVSDEADARIQDQIRAGTFPIRLKPDDWTSGANHWLLDVISPNSRGTAAVIASFRQLVPDGRMKIHPGILRLLDAETLKRWGGGKGAGSSSPSAPDVPQEQKDLSQ